MHRCQVCARRIKLKIGGAVAAHYVQGQPCHGAGYPPIEVSDERLFEVAEIAKANADHARGRLVALYESRANFIDPGLIRLYDRLSARSEKLARRLKRHRLWPQRFERQMQTQGWGEPPPAYLLGG